MAVSSIHSVTLHSPTLRQCPERACPLPVSSMGASPHDVLLREPRRSPNSVWLLPALLAGGGHSVQPRRGSLLATGAASTFPGVGRSPVKVRTYRHSCHFGTTTSDQGRIVALSQALLEV